MKNSDFKKRFKSISLKIWSKVTTIDEIKGQWIAGARLSPQILGRLKRSVLITSTGSSTRIEGVRLSDEDIEKVIRGIVIQKFTDRDKQEARSYYELLENVFNSWQHIHLNVSTIKHFHKEMLKYVEKDLKHRGEYKRKENKVGIVDNDGKILQTVFDTTPAFLVEKEMIELIEWTNDALHKEEIHPLLVIGNFVVDFLLIHPFQDGNGRISRILTNFLLLKAGYPFVPYISHEKLIEDNKADYYVSLRKSQNTLQSNKPNISQWLVFFLDMVHQQSKLALELLSRENIEKLLSEKQLSVWRYIEKAGEASPREMSKETGVARPTINQVLDRLLQFKKIERIGLGRSTRYRKV